MVQDKAAAASIEQTDFDWNFMKSSSYFQLDFSGRPIESPKPIADDVRNGGHPKGS
jgi:hypothetical protein